MWSIKTVAPNKVFLPSMPFRQWRLYLDKTYPYTFAQHLGHHQAGVSVLILKLLQTCHASPVTVSALSTPGCAYRASFVARIYKVVDALLPLCATFS